MIVENILDFTGNDFHQAIEDSRISEPAAKVDPVWRDYSVGNFRPVASDARERLAANGVDNDVASVSENLISQCLDEIAHRVRFERYGSENEPVQTYLEEFAAKNRMKEVVPSLIRRVQTDGNAAMSISWKRAVPGREDKSRPVLHHESWWDGKYGMFVATDDTNETVWAAADWFDRDNVDRRTVWAPDRVLRFIKDGSGWRLIEEVPRVRPDGRPLGVPVAHFTNGPPTYGRYAESTVAKVIGSQDALNATLFNRQAVVALTGSPIYWGIGVTQTEDMQVIPGTMWTSANPQARFGAIMPGQLEALHKEATDLRSTISGAFPVPSYRIGSGDWPSALALQRSDGPMIAACQSLINSIDPGLILLAHRGIELENALGDMTLEEGADAAKITIHFEPVDQVDPATKVEIDLSTVELYKELETLTKVMQEKIGILTKVEREALERELREREAQFAVAPTQTGTEFGTNGNTRNNQAAANAR